MPISPSFLALRIVYLAQKRSRKRLSISEKSLEALAQCSVLGIGYLGDLKTSLEGLGYFFGRLEKGGYGLFPIQSLNGARSLTLAENDRDTFFGYSEVELSGLLIGNIVADKPLLPENDALIEQPPIKVAVWNQLISLAKEKKPITQGGLAAALQLSHHKQLEKPLKALALYCANEQLPHLEYLVIKQSTGLPTNITDQQKNDCKKELDKVYSHDWQSIPNPFVDEDNKLDKGSQAEPPLLLEYLSSKESVADDTNSNELTDEALKSEAPIIAHDNETGADAEKSKKHERGGYPYIYV